MARPTRKSVSRVRRGPAGVLMESPARRRPGACPAAVYRTRLRAGGMMSSGGRRRSTSERRARARPGGGVRRLAIGIGAAALAASGLAACGTAGASSGAVTLNLYFYPDKSGATQTAINNCNAQHKNKYAISYQELPTGSDGQRQQMARRLAAHDSSMDILGLDVTWEAEFAQAGWIVPWTGKYQAEA